MAVKTTSAMCVLNDALEALQLVSIRRPIPDLGGAYLY